ncbi:MAG: hypothetical protein IPL03_16245 [Sterolibacteriaceae bacterium]|nr:hypothetical protein [Candidatus Methylophosphatis haderslevensis]
MRGYRVYFGLGSATVVVALCGLFREQAVAYRFGTRDAADVFIAAIQIPALLLNVFSSSLGAGLVPFLVARGMGGPLDGDIETGRIHAIVYAVVAIVFIAGGLAASLYVPFIAPGFSVAKAKLLSDVLLVLCLSGILAGVGAYWVILLQAGNRFSRPALTAALPPALAAAFCLVCDWGTWAPVVGTAAGFALQTVVLYLLVRSAQIGVAPRRGLPAHLPLASQVTSAAAATGLMSGATVIANAWAASLGAGSVATLGFANVAITAVVGFGLKVVGGPLLNDYSQLAAAGDWPRFIEALRRHVSVAWSAGCAVAVAMFFLAEPIVGVLFQRGSFAPEQTAEVAGILFLLAMQLPWHVAGALVTRALSACQANTVLLEAAAINLAVCVALCWFLVDARGLKGVAIAVSGMYCASFVYCVFRLRGIVRKAVGNGRS